MIGSVSARQIKLETQGGELNQVKYAQGKFFPYSKFRIVNYNSFLISVTFDNYCSYTLLPIYITCSISFKFLIYPIYGILVHISIPLPLLHIVWYILVLGYINSIPIIPDAKPWTGWLLYELGFTQVIN